MSAMSNVREFIESLPNETRFIGETAVKELRQNGTSWEWLETALNIKSKEDWSKYGFGLLFTDSFCAQVQKKLNKQKSQEVCELWSEDEQPEHPETIVRKVAFDGGNSKEVHLGTETFLIKSRPASSKPIDKMTEEEFFSMVIEQHRSAELFCARCWADTYGEESEYLRQYEAEDRDMTDEQIARKYLQHRWG